MEGASEKGEFRLYDLTKDPSESNDVANRHPEVAEDYLRQLKQWDASLPRKKKQ
ncbi:hypothetical protein [Pontiella sulfatireligans]|uniref:hypothetical protein n=1 Tax=Pontiella sulfatireligans TaxID=2750658 RepID=UPI0014443909|nr:hypothetical protein [Pontiella sulfatireligans]